MATNDRTVTIRLPAVLLNLLDNRASWDRSRGWHVRQALRYYLEKPLDLESYVQAARRRSATPAQRAGLKRLQATLDELLAEGGEG